ncbi:metal ABC transporter permease [Kineosporiaceae bacterium B12]|nr:metal ABC transporter permease [Kineococcus rubinsiae]
MLELWSYDFMRRALLAAALVGVAAPLVGAFVVQRGLSLIGDGLGHVALTGVAAGVLTGSAPVWTALVAAVAAALAVEAVRARGRTGGDVALAVISYGGIAGGVVLMSAAPPGSPANLESYLFGALTTTSPADVRTFGALALVLLVAVLLLRPWFFAVSSDEEHARAVGLPARALTAGLAVLTAVTVVLSMRTVGLLLVSALVVVPVAAAQRTCTSFAAVQVTACAVGLVAGTGGVVASYRLGTPPGGTIVLLALAIFLVAVLASGWRALTRWAVPPRTRARRP